MEDKNTILEMADSLEKTGEVRITDGIKEIFIQVYEEDETLFFSGSNEFDSAVDAVEWAVNELGGVENIEEWE
ncbi:hypothetical protein [Clostridium oryzae]|uniref:Uncharacterized protein n=1 Tax=Clostridium oryzae TaxID=1450648 RepID=A0A1V4IP70_9CLOT|nr:hypothetical protein [Clostridium oryzae]OPJ61679.1 hypothetical protein CLORY_21790 [Clostridium oryzae]